MFIMFFEADKVSCLPMARSCRLLIEASRPQLMEAENLPKTPKAMKLWGPLPVRGLEHGSSQQSSRGPFNVVSF